MEKILAVIPCQGWNISVKDKNIRKLNGKTLIEIAYKCLKKIKGIDKVIYPPIVKSMLKLLLNLI